MTTPWRLDVTKQAQDDLKRVPSKDRERIARRLGGLTDNPPQGDVVKLQGDDARYRLRVGDWRVIFERVRDSRTVVVLAVHHRQGAYKA